MTCFFIDDRGRMRAVPEGDSPHPPVKAKLSFFGTKTIQDQRQDIFAGRGISGPFYLTRVPLLEETERVRVEVRDKSRYDIVLRTETKVRDVDYELDYYTGRLMFRQPIPTYDENNDPVYIYVDYEYLTVNNNDDDEQYITGSRGEVTLFNKIKAAGQVITENRSEYSHTIAGIDSIVQLTENIRLQGEYAHSEKTGEQVTADVTEPQEQTKGKAGDAMRIEGSASFFENKLQLQTYATQIDNNFSNPVNVTEQGIQKYGATGQLDITKNLTAIVDHEVARSMKDKIYDRYTKGDLFFKNDLLFLSTGYAYDEMIDEKKEMENPVKHEINLKGGVKFTDKIIASTEYSWQRELYDKSFKGEIDKLSPRLDVKLDENTSLYVRHDYTREKTRDVPGGLVNNVSAFGIMREKDGKRSYIEYGFVGGKVDSTSLGTEQEIPIGDRVRIVSRAGQVITKDKNEEVVGYNSKIKITKDFSIGGAFERTKTTGDTDYEETATSITADYIRDEDNRLGAKFEYRSDKTRRQYNAGLDSKFNVSDETYALVKAEYHTEGDWKQEEDLRGQKRIIGGLGYRPIDNDKLDILAKYEYKEGLDNTSISPSDYGSHIASIEGIYDITRRLELFCKYALKGVTEDVDEMSTHSLTDLKTAKLIYTFNRFLDVRGTYRIFQNYNTNTMKQGAAGEVGITFFDHLRVALGYNFLKYEDKYSTDEDYQGVGPYIEMTYKFMDEADKLFESRKEMLRRFADESAIELYMISRIPGDEKFVEEMRTCYTQGMKWYKLGKYEEAIACLTEGMEAYYAARKYADTAESKKEQFSLYLKQGEKFYRNGMKEEAFRILEKAYGINAYDKKLLGLMSGVRSGIREERSKRRKILAMKLEGIEKIAVSKDDTKLILETIKLHFATGREFFAIGDYKEAVSEWKEGLNIAERASRDYREMEEERKIFVRELESICEMAHLHLQRGDCFKSKAELERGLNLIGRALE